MPENQNVIGSLQPFKAPNPLEIGLNVAHLGNVITETRMRQKQLADSMQMQAAYKDPNGPMEYLKENAPHLIPTYIGAQSEVNKGIAQNQSEQLSLVGGKLNIMSKALSTVSDQPSYERAMQFLSANNAIPQGVQPPPQFDAKTVTQYANWVSTAQEKIESAVKQQQAQTGTGELNLHEKQYLSPSAPQPTVADKAALTSNILTSKNTVKTIDSVIGNMDRLLGKDGSGSSALKSVTTAPGLAASYIWLTPEHGVATAIESIKSFAASQGLDLLRGGRVSEPLIKTAQDLVTNLDIRNGTVATVRSINQLKAIYQEARKNMLEGQRVNESLYNNPGGPAAAAPATAPRPRSNGVLTNKEIESAAIIRGIDPVKAREMLINAGYKVE